MKNHGDLEATQRDGMSQKGNSSAIVTNPKSKFQIPKSPGSMVGLAMTKLSDFPNIISFDVEEWFHLRRTEDCFPLERWNDLPARLPNCLESILDLLAKTDNRATFFWLGWCAERHPGWVRRVAEAGHEIACHGWGHRALDQLADDEFRDELRRTRALLEDLGGRPVRGFRAPSLSLGPTTAWMLEVLAEEGFAYDSSLLTTALRFNHPGKKPRLTTGGEKRQALRGDAERPAPGCSPPARSLSGLTAHLSNVLPWRWESKAGPIIELPLSVLPWGPVNLPFAGGLFFRCAPYWAVAATIRRFNARGAAAVMYAHPWEFDTESPTLAASRLERFSHRFRLAGGRRKYVRLLKDFRFIPAAEAIERLDIQTLS